MDITDVPRFAGYRGSQGALMEMTTVWTLSQMLPILRGFFLGRCSGFGHLPSDLGSLGIRPEPQ